MLSDPLTTLGTADRNRLEALLVEFDLNWAPDRLPAAVAQLPAAGRPRAAGLRELVRIDMERQARLGHPVPLDEYAARYPELLETGVGLAPLSPTADEPTPHLHAPAGPPKLPDVFGRYRILRPLGRGGMGSVYLARDTELDRLVALKVPHFRPDDPDAAERFAREARAAATIDHPNVCRVYDVGRIDGLPFLTMAYVDGRTLADEMRADPFSPRRAAEVVRDVARGMAEAHRLGVVHRDLKPGNIQMAPDGRPVVTDFGLARRAADDPRLTASGAILGTPLYMSPEQVAGDTDRVGPASDVYSLGVVLYELLAARPPFGLDRTEMMAATLSKDPPRPSAVRAGLDPRLDAVVLRAMAKRPGDRAGMSELADALDAWLTDQGPRPARRRPWHLVAAAAVAVALLLALPAGVKLGWFGGPRGPGPEEKKTEGDTKGDQAKQGGDAKTEAKAAADPKPLGTGTVADADGLIAVGFSPDGRQVYTAALAKGYVSIRRWDAATGREEPVPLKRLLVNWAAFGPNGRDVLVGGGMQYVDLYQLSDGEQVGRFNTGPHAKVGAISRDGKRVMVGYQEISGKARWARVWQVDSGRLVDGYDGHKEEIRVVALSDDGRWAYSASPDREALWEVGGRTRDTSEEKIARSAAPVPHSDHFLIGSRHGGIEEYAVSATGKVRLFDGRHGFEASCLTVSADGRLAASGGSDRLVLVWDVPAGRQRWKLDGHTAPVTGVAFSPDGRRLASCAADRTWRVWDLPEGP